MKKTLFVALLLLPVFSIKAQGTAMKFDNVKKLKEGKVIFALESNEQIDENIKNAVKNIWDFNMNYEFLPKVEAKKKAKESDGNIFVIYIDTESSKSLGRSSVSYKNDVDYSQDRTTYTKTRVTHITHTFSQGYYIGINNGGNAPYAKQYISVGEDGSLPETYITYGLSGLQSMIKTQYENEYNNGTEVYKHYSKNSNRLQGYTLYIPDAWISDKLTIDIAKATYTFPIEITSEEKWGEAILKKEPKVAYVMIVPYPINGQFIYAHNIVSADDCRLIATMYSGKKSEISVNELKKYQKEAEGK